MSETIEAPAQPAVSAASICSAAVERCMDAYKKAYRACAAQGGDQYDRNDAGSNAYRLAMPCTDSIAEIRAFIACVAYGITMEVFKRNEPNQLLYAAQVALSSRRRRKAGKKQPTPSPV